MNGSADAARRRECIEEVTLRFPFRGYMEANPDSYDAVARNCARLLRPGASVLDFGSGPCDKAAVLSRFGYRCVAVDDLADDWHALGDNRDKILAFAQRAGVRLIVTDRIPEDLEPNSFDMVMLHDVIEHFADSPRNLLLKLLELVKPGGYLYISVPNAVNLRKRLLVLSGRTNYPRFSAYYWSTEWRGHKREYVKDDLERLCGCLGLKKIMLAGQHHRLSALPWWSRGIFRATLGRFDSLRDALALIGQKGPDWQPRALTVPEHREILQRETPYRYGA
jgi:SAM-dependent methyltransferase